MLINKKNNKNNKVKNIKGLLKSASACLLGASASLASQGQALTDDIQADVAVLLYSEIDRVSALEPAIALQKTFDDESVLGVKLVLDSLSGASHNGAAPSDSVQTFTRPSGLGSYSTAAGETPLDDSFRDTRINLSASYQHDLNRLDKMIWGANASNEYDFLSVGASATFLRDMNQRNTTLSAGTSFELDSIRAVGGFATPLSEMKASSQGQEKIGSSHTRVMAEVLLGLTQVLDHKTLLQVNYGFALSDGEHNDPYKIISVLNSDGSLNPANGLNGTYLYEKRPGTRNKQSLFSKIKRFLSGNVADISYRYMWDDWGIESSTTEVHYRINFSRGWYVEPHVRYYDQKAADFYRTSITSAENTPSTLPSHLSADYRLGDMLATTLGLKFGFLSSNGNQSSVRIEYYQQNSPHDSGDVDAIIAQYNYRF